MNLLIRNPVFLKNVQTKAAKGGVICNTAKIDSVDPSNLWQKKKWDYTTWTKSWTAGQTHLHCTESEGDKFFQISLLNTYKYHKI